MKRKTDQIFQINSDVVFVKGVLNGAIYNFNSGKVYSINNKAKSIIESMIVRGDNLNDVISKNYLNSLIEAGLYSKAFPVSPYCYEQESLIDLQFVWLELTHACNLKCVHCYEGDEHKNSSEQLSLNRWLEILAELKMVKCKRIQFIGGEPFLSPFLLKLIDHAKALEFESITVFTNLTMLPFDLIACFVRNNVKIKFSLYGHNSETHDGITKVNGSFTKIINNVKVLIENGLKPIPSVIIMRENQNSVENIKEFIRELGLNYSGYDIIRNIYGGDQGGHIPTNSDLVNTKNRKNPDFHTTKNKFNKNRNQNSCWYGKCAIADNGDVLPCVFERNIIYGNIKKLSISNILKSESLKKYWHLHYGKIEVCQDCEFRFACKDCRPLGMSMSGNIYSKNYRCDYNPYTGEWSSSHSKKMKEASG